MDTVVITEKVVAMEKVLTTERVAIMEEELTYGKGGDYDYDVGYSRPFGTSLGSAWQCS